ncbi:MAG TPA: TadE family protein [Symbiobacteriaceae bacterium]|jgi:hypothetical protein
MQCRRRGHSGQAVAELVIVAPILLLILMATIGFGHWIYTQMIVVESANRAARLAAVLYGDSTVPQDDAYRRTRDSALALLGAGLRGNDRDVVIQIIDPDIHVTVRYRTNVFVPFLRPWLGDQLNVEHESIYRIERDTA